MHRRDAEDAERQGRGREGRPILLSLVGLCVLCVSAAQKPEPQAEKIGEHRYRIGRVVVDTAARVAEVPCRVNMRRGMIEYLAVASDGKLHESVLKVEAEPLHVHVALMLLGLEPGQRPRFQGDPEPIRARSEGASHSEVEARVAWQQAGRERSARLEEWAWDIPAKRPMAAVAWRFTGVAAAGARPATAEQRSVVATYRDPDAVLNNPLPTGGDDTVYKANERVVPPVGTAVRLLLRPTGEGKTRRSPAGAGTRDTEGRGAEGEK